MPARLRKRHSMCSVVPGNTMSSPVVLCAIGPSVWRNRTVGGWRVESTSCHHPPHRVVYHLVDLVVVLLVEADAPRLLAVKVSAHTAPPLRALQPVLACGTVQCSTIQHRHSTKQYSSVYLEQCRASFVFAKFVGSFKDK